MIASFSESLLKTIEKNIWTANVTLIWEEIYLQEN